MFKGALGAPYELCPNGRVVNKKERRPNKAFQPRL